MSPCIKHCKLPFPSPGLLAILGTDFFNFFRYRIRVTVTVRVEVRFEVRYKGEGKH